MLDVLLRNWLHGAARQKLYQAATQAVGQQMQGAPAEPSAELRERPCDVGLIFASASESGGLEDLLAGAIATQAGGMELAGGLQGRHIILARAGAGPAAAKAAQLLIAGHKPQWIVAAGFATGLVPDLKRYDMLLADDLIDDAGQRVDPGLGMPAEVARSTPNLRVGRLLSLDRVPHTPAEKHALGEQHQTIAADTQSLAIAQVCRQEHVHFLALHIIRETCDDELPTDVEHVARQKSTAGFLGAAMGALMNRPGSMKEWLQQKEDSLLASDRLAKLLAAVIVQLAPQRASA